MKKEFVLITGLFGVSLFGFFIGLKFKTGEKPLKSVLFSCPYDRYMEPIWLLSYWKSHVLQKPFVKKIRSTDQHPIFRDFNPTMLSLDSLNIDYQVRTPAFKVQDYKNLGLDEEGVLIPLHPFHTPKKVPLVFLGPSNFKELGSKVDQKILKDLLRLKELFGQKLLVVDFSFKDKKFYRKTAVIGLGLGSVFKSDEKTLFIQFDLNELEKNGLKIQTFIQQIPLIANRGVFVLDLTKRGMGILKGIEKKQFNLLQVL